ncbi:MAG TPA: hypothetical protein VFS08_05570, partial [Gemmatimonadaceae bacterium]|nr:hypothetical protein [Gemmatimonadaceae bacterium]
RASIEAAAALRAVDPRARLVHAEPLIHIAVDPARRRDRAAAARYREAQFEAWDMLAGRSAPELGGHPDCLDVVGVNYYPRNQWVHRGRTLPPGDPLHRPLRRLLAEVHARYGRPIVVAETGTEDDARAAWLRHVGREVRLARRAGVPVEGICLYPILNHPGWDDDRHCHNGLWDYADAAGRRAVHGPLARELRRQQRLLGDAGVGIGG